RVRRFVPRVGTAFVFILSLGTCECSLRGGLVHEPRRQQIVMTETTTPSQLAPAGRLATQQRTRRNSSWHHNEVRSGSAIASRNALSSSASTSCGTFW